MWFVAYNRKIADGGYEYLNIITEDFPLDWLMNNRECCIIFYKRLPEGSMELVDKWRKEFNNEYDDSCL